MYIVDHFYRFAQGQVWSEVSQYLERVGVNLLGIDGETMFLMNQRHSGLSMHVRGLQDKLLAAERKKEMEREWMDYARIRNSKLGSSLNALKEIDYLRRTTDREYMLAKKESQRAQVNASIKFPKGFDANHCHRTFDEKWNVTVNPKYVEEKRQYCKINDAWHIHF